MNNRGVIKKPLLLIGDTEKTLTKIPEQSIQMIFTSPLIIMQKFIQTIIHMKNI